MIEYKDMKFDCNDTLMLYKALEDKVPHIQSDNELNKSDIMTIWKQVFGDKMKPVPMYDFNNWK